MFWTLSSVVDNASACSGHTPFVCELLAQVRHHARSNSSSVRQMKTLPSRSNTLKVSVTFFFRDRVLHLPGHQRREFWEINGAVSVGIYSVDHVLQLSLCRILIEDRLTVPNSLVVKVLSPSLLKEEKASLNSAICCDSFNTAFFVLNNLLLFLSAYCFFLPPSSTSSGATTLVSSAAWNC